MTSSLRLHDKEKRELSNDVSIDRELHKAKPTKGEVIVFLDLTNPGAHTFCTVHLTIHISCLFCISTSTTSSTMSDDHDFKDDATPVAKLITKIVTVAEKQDGTTETVNEVIVNHELVEHLTGMNSEFLQSLIKRSSPKKRSASPAEEREPQKANSASRRLDRGPSRASPIVLTGRSRASPATVNGRVGRSSPLFVEQPKPIRLTGGIQILTTCPGAHRVEGSRQVMGFVELKLVDGTYQGEVRFTSRFFQGMTKLPPNCTYFNVDECVDWELFVDPDDLLTLSGADQAKVNGKTAELLQELHDVAQKKPEVALIYHIQNIVENYLTRGRHHYDLKYHALVKFLKDCAPVGMSINNLGFKIIFDMPEKTKDTLAKLENHRAIARG